MYNLKCTVNSLRSATELYKAGNLAEALNNYEAALSSLRLAKEKNEATEKELQMEVEAQLQHYGSKVSAIKILLDKNNAEQTRKKVPTTSKMGQRDEELIQQISCTIISETPKIKFVDVAGLEEEKKFLRQAVVLPIKHPEIFNTSVQPYKGFLLFGFQRKASSSTNSWWPFLPPGTGKSHLAKAVAGEATGTTYFALSASDLVSKYQGESERLIKTLFKLAREKAPSIIFIDEIDSLAMSRSESDGEGARRIKTELFVQMEGVNSENAGVFLLAASNTPHSLDDAFLRRFDKLLYIPMPDSSARQQMFERHFSTCSEITSEVCKEAATKTDGFSGSDISILVKKAKMQDVARLQQSTHFRRIYINHEEKFISCCSDSLGAIQMTLDEIPAGKLSFVAEATKEDVFNCITQAKTRTDQALLRKLEQFAEEKGEIFRPALEKKKWKESKFDKVFIFLWNLF